MSWGCVSGTSIAIKESVWIWQPKSRLSVPPTSFDTVKPKRTIINSIGLGETTQDEEMVLLKVCVSERRIFMVVSFYHFP